MAVGVFRKSLDRVGMNGKVASLNVGEPRLVTYRGMSFRTGILKTPIDAPLTLKRLNFIGDGQADLSAHGGVDKAVYCYPLEHYEFWRREIGRAALPMGQFGENVTTQGLLESELRIGDVLRMGTAVVQVSEPRIPCYKLVMHMDAGSDFSVRFLAANRTGFYCRVLEEGVVARSDAITLVSRDMSSPTVREVIAATQFADRDPVALRRVVRARDISAKWRSRVRRMIDAEARRRIEATSSPAQAMRVDKIVPETSRRHFALAAAGRRRAVVPIRCRANISPSSGPMASKAPTACPRCIRRSATASPSSSCAMRRARSAGRRRGSRRSKPETCSTSSARAAISIPTSTPTRRLCSPRAGIGVTPIMNMIEHATRSGRRDVFAAFGMRRPGEHPLANELADLAAERRRLGVLMAYSRLNGAPPMPGLPAPKHGRLTAADLLPYAAAPLAEVFLCGPGDFIRQMHDGLVEAGISPLNIRYEAFGPSTLLPARRPAGRSAGGVQGRVHAQPYGRGLDAGIGHAAQPRRGGRRLAGFRLPRRQLRPVPDRDQRRQRELCRAHR